MISYVVNQSGALVGEALDVVDELFLDPGVVPDFLLMVLWSCFLSLFSRGWGTMLCGSFEDHYNCFRFVSINFCCHLP